LHFYQFVEVLGGAKCKCKPSSKSVLTEVYLDSNGIKSPPTRENLPPSKFPHGPLPNDPDF
jgi:hypothetical protein